MFRASLTLALVATPLIFATALQSLAGEDTRCFYDCLVVPVLGDSLKTLGAAQEKRLPSRHLQVLVWNIRKGLDRPFASEFETLSRDAELILLQEAVLDPRGGSEFLRRTDGLEWNLGLAWISREFTRTGVATGAKAPILSGSVLRSVDREPGAWTPKTNLVTRHQLQGTDKLLLVINVHAINFRSSAALLRQLELFREDLRRHRGPVLVAGDFNTWDYDRKIAMYGFLEDQGLFHVNPPNDPRSGLVLDHAWTRGLRVESARVVETDGSDHPALRLTVSAL
ncbi:MAG: endonuclease/exonuclease/phosphatase family protein [Oligoflexia bacterium]|nr:endonuclease/exonuclease/phosphatase family protein [Oligoflexia bacterium]